MREIKFRCWNEARKEMVYDVDLYSGGQAFEGIDDNPYDFDRETLGQFTGLKDKNGKEIYEGDVVRMSMDSLNPEETVEVKWDSRGFWRYFNGFDNCEVIGNVYEHPDLLK